MLAYILPPLLPSSVTGLFTPPLDAHNLNVSLTTGLVELDDLVLDARKINALLSPLAPVHVLRGTVDRLAVEVDWRHLLSQPLLVRAHGIHLVLTHNSLEESAAEGGHATLPATAATDANKKHTDQPRTDKDEHKQADFEGERKTSVPVPEPAHGEPALTSSATPHALHPSSPPSSPSQHKSEPARHMNEPAQQDESPSTSALIQAAVDAKLAALAQAQPNALNFTPPAGLDWSTLGLNSTTKRLVSIVMRALHVEASDIVIEYEHTPCHSHAPEFAPATGAVEKVPLETVTPSATHVQELHAQMKTLGIAEELSTRLGIQIKSAKLESFKSTAEQLGLPKTMSMIKQLHIEDFSVWCDPPPSAEAATPAEEKTSDPSDPVKPRLHSFILPPVTTNFHLATNGQMDLKLDMMLKTLCPSLLMSVRPEQLQAIVSVLASIQEHAAAAQARLELIAAHHFRAATASERKRYLEFYSLVLIGKKLTSGQQSALDSIEREVTFTDLLGLRAIAFSALQDEAAREERLREVASPEPPKEAESPLAEETEEPGFFQTLWNYVTLTDEEQQPATHHQAPSTNSDTELVKKAAAVPVPAE